MNDAFAFLVSGPLSGVADSWRVIPLSYFQVVDAGLDALATSAQDTQESRVKAVAMPASFPGDKRGLIGRGQVLKNDVDKDSSNSIERY